MKKITAILILMFAISSSIFAQTTKTYCDSIESVITAQMSGTKASLAVKSTGTVISQEWIFGDGTANSKDKTPTHDYTKAGTYTTCVYLILDNIRDRNKPCTTKICKTITITSNDPCASFNPTFNYAIDKANSVVTFEANVGTNYTYKWDFGDNTTSTDRVVKHTYKPGTYKVCVTITDPATKCTKTVCKEVVVEAASDPCANFSPSVDFSVDANGLATFKGANTTGLSYSWNFGDGTTGTAAAGTHQYKPGSYKACVTVVYVSGTTKCTKTLCKEFTVAERKDSCADFNPKFEYSVGKEGVVTFWGAGNTTNTLTYTWSYGDGTSGTGMQNTHTYKPGTYKVCVTIYDTKTGCKKVVCNEITVPGTNTDPCKDFNPTFGYKVDGNTVVLEAQSGATYTYQWSINGVTSKDRIVKFDFKKPGTYKVCVLITDTKTKCSKTVCKEIIIKEKETSDPCKNFNPKVSFQTNGLKATFEVDGGKGATMEWNFGDNTKGSSDRKVTHTFAKSGKYNICVTVYDAKRKCKKTICFTITVEGKSSDPCADFNPEFNFSINGSTVTVEGKNISGVEYSWSWGDKLGDKGRTGSHTYKVAGKYNVCMTAYNPTTKCTKTVCKTIEVGKQRIETPQTGSTEKIVAYPNPADQKISVITLSTSDAKIYVKDAQGNEVLRYDATPNENKTVDMAIDSLPKGTYYINVEQDGKITTTKFVK